MSDDRPQSGGRLELAQELQRIDQEARERHRALTARLDDLSGGVVKAAQEARAETGEAARQLLKIANQLLQDRGWTWSALLVGALMLGLAAMIVTVIHKFAPAHPQTLLHIGELRGRADRLEEQQSDILARLRRLDGGQAATRSRPSEDGLTGGVRN